MSGPAPRTHFSAADISAMPERRHVHQFNDNAVRLTRSLTDLAGFTDMGVHLVRVEPGRESTEFHFHGQDEEFVYVLSGRAVADIGDETIEIGPGDFMAFGKGSPPHVMRVPADAAEPATYLMGGTRSPVDVCTYPRKGLRMYRVDGRKEYVALDALKKVDP